MKTLLTLALLTLAFILPAAEPVTPKVKGFYADSFLSLSTPDFSHGESYAYGLGVGYQFNPTLSGSLRVTHAGLNIENNAVSTVGGRVEARLPIPYVTGYGFLGAAFDLGPDEWRLQPGIGCEFGMSRVMKGMSLIAEAGLDANLRGSSGFLFSGGVRWRF